MCTAQSHIHESTKRQTISPRTYQVGKLFEKIQRIKQNDNDILRELYKKLQELLGSDVLTPDMKKEINTEFDVDKSIREAIIDLDDDSCPIVVTGETSSGKSSFVNLLLGVFLMPQSTLTCTSTICRIHNTDEKAVRLTDANDKMETLDISTNINVKEMQDLLKKFICAPSASEDLTAKNNSLHNYKFIDIYWPIPMFKGKGNIVIVDTPGFGPDNPNLMEKLYEYWPKALAFVYVLNTPNVGGIQSDRVFKIHEKLKICSGKENIDFFDPDRSLFICNKWDQIHEDEDEVFQTVQTTLERQWSGFQSNKLFKLSTREEMKHINEGCTPEFTKIIEEMTNMIPAATTEKYRRHMLWLKRVVEKMLYLVSARIRHSYKTQEEKDAHAKKVEHRISFVTRDIVIKKEAAYSKAIQYFNQVVERVYVHLHEESTFRKMFSWAASDLPDLNDIDEIIAAVNDIIFQRITEEIKRKMHMSGNCNLESFKYDLFHAECFQILEQCETIEEIILQGDELHLKQRKTQTSKRNSLSNFTLSSRGKVYLAISSPILIPTTLAVGVAVGIVLLPVKVGCLVKDATKRLLKVRKYRTDKVQFAEKRAKLMLKEITTQYLSNAIEESVLKPVNEYITEFFDKIIPNRIDAGIELMHNIKHDIRAPIEIRKQSHAIETEILLVYGHIIAADIELFPPENLVINKPHKGDVTTTIKLNGEVINVSMKSIMMTDDRNDKFITLGEINILRKHQHQNLIKFYGIQHIEEHGSNGFRVLMELCETDLEKRVINEGILFRKAVQYLKGFLDGISHLHMNGIIHKDIRLETILIKGDEVKISDGGCGRNRLKGEIVGPPIIRAPEVLKSSCYGIEADIFQIGIVLWEVHYRRRAFYEEITTYEKLSYAILGGRRPCFDPMCRNANVRSVIEGCFEDNPKKRPSASQIKKILGELEL